MLPGATALSLVAVDLGPQPLIYRPNIPKCSIPPKENWNGSTKVTKLPNQSPVARAYEG